VAVATPNLTTPCPNCGCGTVPGEPVLVGSTRLSQPGYFATSGDRGLSLDELASSERLCVCDECNYIVDRPLPSEDEFWWV
jgi:hypothetical protein